LSSFWHDQVSRDNRHYERWPGPALVRLALSLERRGLALEVTERLEQGASLAPEVPSIVGAALSCRGLVDSDPDILLRAVDLAATSRRALDHAATCEDAATVLARQQRAREARAVLELAIERYETMGASAFALRAIARLRDVGGRRGVRGTRLRITVNSYSWNG
jgi:hypothetical protein